MTDVARPTATLIPEEPRRLMSTDIAERFAQPTELDALTVAFGAVGTVFELMPTYEEIPKEFRAWSNPFAKLQRKWFFEGLPEWPLKPKPGIDQTKALAHLSAIQGSFEPKHQHKEAGVAYLMSLWFEPPN